MSKSPPANATAGQDLERLLCAKGPIPRHIGAEDAAAMLGLPLKRFLALVDAGVFSRAPTDEVGRMPALINSKDAMRLLGIHSGKIFFARVRGCIYRQVARNTFNTAQLIQDEQNRRQFHLTAIDEH